eukprot:10044365-Ditylum_brightwellii.AAC.1
MQGPPSYTVAKTLFKGDALTVFKQAEIAHRNDCFELKQCAKYAKPNINQNKADKVTYKDLNAFVNAKVMAPLNKANKSQKKRKEKEVDINAFDKFCSLNVESSEKEEELNVYAPVAADNNDSSTSCILSENRNINVK